MSNQQSSAFIVNYTLTNGEKGDFEAISLSNTLAALDFCQWAFDCSMEVSEIKVSKGNQDEE